MTVKQLIETLSKFDPEAHVFVSMCEDSAELDAHDIESMDRLFDADAGDQIDGNFVVITTWD